MRAAQLPILAATALAASVLTLAGCGSEDEAAPPDVDTTELREALEDGSCPAENLVLRSGHTYSSAAVRNAREKSVFHVHEVDLELSPPVDWLQDPYNSKAFRGRLADLAWVEVLFHAYRENGDVAALRQARGLVLDWVASQPRGWDQTSDQAWEGKAVGDRVLDIAYLARAAECEGILRDEELELLASSISEHVQVLTDPAIYEPTNHGLYMDLSLLLLARQLPGEQAAEWQRIAQERFDETFASRIVEDEGFWLEHSAGYQILLTKLLAKSLNTPGFNAGELEPVLDQMRETTGWLVMPDGQIPQFGHSDLVNAPDFAVSRARDDRGMLSLLETGLAVVKEPGSYLSVVAMFHNTAHKQADELSFDLFEEGLRIVSDSGLYNKDRNDYYAFASSPAAHSTLTVDGEPFPIDEQHVYGSGLLASGEGDGWYAILGTNPLLEDAGVEHHRLFLYRPGEALIVADAVRSGEEHAYRRHFQLGPEIDLPSPPGELAATRSPGDQVIFTAPGYAGTLTSTASTGTQELDAVRGSRDPLRGFVFPSFRERIPRWTLTYESRAADADYAAAFDFSGAGLEADVVEFTPRSMTLELTSPSAEPVTVEITRNGENLSVSEG